MEKRIREEVKIYKIILNHMCSRAEAKEIVAFSTDYDKLVQWYESQKAPVPWRDGQWYKTFAEGSPLEWFNPCGSILLNDPGHFGHGILEEWVPIEVFNDVLSSGRLLYIE